MRRRLGIVLGTATFMTLLSAPSCNGGAAAANEAHRTTSVRQPFRDTPWPTPEDEVPLAEVHGRVLFHTTGLPAIVQVCAFSLEGEAKERRAVASKQAFGRGDYRLLVPPDTDLLVLALPVEPSPHTYVLAGPEDDDHILDVVRLDCGPGRLQARGALGESSRAPDLTLRRPQVVKGTVRTPDGRPHTSCAVQLHASNATKLLFGQGCVAYLLDDGRVINGMKCWTNSAGEFLLPLPEGELDGIQVVVQTTFGQRVVQPVVADLSSTPAPIVLEIPLPTILRATVGGAAVRMNGIQFEGQPSEPVHGLTTYSLLPTTRARVRVLFEPFASRWFDLGPEHGGKTIDLETDARECGTLLLRFAPPTHLRGARVHWRTAEGSRGELRGVARTDGTVPIWLPPGRYHLTVHADPAGPYVPTELEVDITATPSERTAPIELGGRFFVCAIDGRGKCRAGRIAVKDAHGNDVTGAFSREQTREKQIGGVGELLPGGPNHLVNALRPGDYELRFEFDNVAPIRERVHITAGGEARVDVRLP